MDESNQLTLQFAESKRFAPFYQQETVDRYNSCPQVFDFNLLVISNQFSDKPSPQNCAKWIH